MCIVTVMNHGLRNGGGVGDILRKPSKDVSTFPPILQVPPFPASACDIVQSRQFPTPAHCRCYGGSLRQPVLALRLGKV